jgi:signal transduction histidine kinase
MNAPFLCGLTAAWAIALVAVGIFFCLAFALGRREAEYLLFGILALAFACITAGISYGYSATTLAQWHIGSTVAHVASALGISVHLHFVLRYARARLLRPVVGATYALALAYAVIRAAGWWWVQDSERLQVTELFGHRISHMTTWPLPHAVSYYVFAVLSLIAAVVVLSRAYRAGQREALLALLGSVALALAGANDALLASGTGINTVYLLPHGFLLYAFGLAATLLYRYRSATSKLEQTVTSLQERTAELRHSYDELSSIEDELVKQEQLAAVGELAASIAHEVRNPLAIIVNATASLRRPGIREQDRQTLLGIVDEEASRLNGLVTDLLRFARPFSATRCEVDLCQVSERAGAVAGAQHRVAFSFPEDPRLCTVYADPGLLRVALENLIENAAQSMPGGGNILVSAQSALLGEQPCLRVEVADDGPGMEADVLRRALDPFFTTRSTGTGLGLPIVKRIMDAHGGELVIESEPGSGTRIALVFPALEPDQQAAGRSSRTRERRGRAPNPIDGQNPSPNGSR